MNKKIISFTLILVLSCACIFASFDGRSTIGVNYSYEKDNYFGLSTNHTGYFNDGSLGYFIGADADFKISGTSGFRINMLIGPTYRYRFENIPMSIELAAGLSLGGSNVTESFYFGLGGYVGAAYSLSNHIDLLLGAKLGSNFLNIPYNDPKFNAKGDFYVTPQIGIGFTY